MTPSLLHGRAITSGLGDRFGNFLTVAALARAINTDCHIFWINDEVASGRTYPFESFQKYVRLPKNLIVHYDASLTRSSILTGRAVGAHERLVEIVHSGNELPANNGYDCVYTLAHKALSVPGHTIDGAAMERAFRSVSREWIVTPDRQSSTAMPYVVLHLRGGDRSTAPHLRQQEFATERVLRAIGSEIEVVAITDDHELLEYYTSRFPNLRYDTIESDAEDKDYADMLTLMNAKGIVQHSAGGWSAYSSVIAMARQIPLINTCLGREKNRLAEFRDRGGCPAELRSAVDAGEIQRFVEDLNDYAGGVARAQNSHC